MSLAHNIFPSDKNEIEYFSDLSVDGEFEVTLPLTDGNRRERRLTLVHFQTQSPFIPSSVQKLYDASDAEGGIGQTSKFYVMTVDTEKLFDTDITERFDTLKPNYRWKYYNDVIEAYEESSKEKGLVVNSKYLNELTTSFWKDNVSDDFNFNNAVQVFTEIGTKVTESDIGGEKFQISTMKPDEMKMYVFPLDFYYPLVTQTDHGGMGTEVDVGSIPSLNYDAALRSMVRYALIDMNKGDVRSAFTESKRCAYLEYDITDPKDANKTITKYVFAWTLGNPFFFDCTSDNPDKGYLFRYLFLRDNDRKGSVYGRHGSYVNFTGMEKDGVIGEVNNTFMDGFFLDLGYSMASTSIYDSNKENCLMNVFRCNWGFVFAGCLKFYFTNYQNIPDMPFVLEDVVKNLSKFDDKQVLGRDILGFFCGELGVPEKWISNVRSTAIFNRPTNMSFYGSDLVLRLLCDQVQTIVSGRKRKKSRLAQVLATLVANEQTYQSFNGTDNRIVFQPPTFRPLLYLQQEQSIIVGSSSRTLKFYLLNSDDQPVKFSPGDKAYIRLKIEPV